MNQKKILITGNLGYVGVELVKFLKKQDKNLFLIGYDVGYFKKNWFTQSLKKNKYIDHQITSDIRANNFRSLSSLKIDTIIHLAAVSNDPMGNFFIKPTREINTIYTKKLIDWAKKNKVKKFIFASSCSVYGFSNNICNENSKTNPLTEYAKSKLKIETYLKSRVSKKFKGITLRFSTACGSSDMLRLDLVLNDFVASAIATKKIKLLSDGNALRPLIDVVDMAKAFWWAEKYNKKIFECVNVGNDKMNYKIVDLAYLVKKSLPNAKISINKLNADNRSYKANFSKYKKLFSGYNKMKGAKYSISKLIKTIRKSKFKDKNFRSGNFMRLVSLKKQIEKKQINKNLKILNDKRYYN
jgi:nucleoside-diphosphate-sugar epimerase